MSMRPGSTHNLPSCDGTEQHQLLLQFSLFYFKQRRRALTEKVMLARAVDDRHRFARVLVLHRVKVAIFADVVKDLDFVLHYAPQFGRLLHGQQVGDSALEKKNVNFTRTLCKNDTIGERGEKKSKASDELFGFASSAYRCVVQHGLAEHRLSRSKVDRRTGQQENRKRKEHQSVRSGQQTNRNKEHV